MSNTLPNNYRWYALGILLSVNLLNYIDRQILYAVFPLIKADLNLSDTALGMLGSAFMTCYMCSAPLLGWLGDRSSRTRLASWGLGTWSVATALAGFAPGYGTLLAARSLVGVGEASFGTVTPGLLADYFPKERRGQILAYFFLAIPVGSALGYLLGGQLGQRFGWHSAFLIVGIPGLLLALPLRFMKEPLRSPGNQALEIRLVPNLAGYTTLLRNRSFIATTASLAAMTFALGGLAQWIPSFLHRVHHLDIAKGNTLFGGITVIAGITGTLAGGWLGDKLQKRSQKGYLLISGWGFLIGAPITAYALVSPSLWSCLAAMLCAEFFLFLNTGPLNTVIVNVTAPPIRSMAFAVNIFFIHAFGDAISPPIIGWISDLANLRTALLITPLALVIAAIACFICTRFIVADTTLMDS